MLQDWIDFHDCRENQAVVSGVITISVTHVFSKSGNYARTIPGPSTEEDLRARICLYRRIIGSGVCMSILAYWHIIAYILYESSYNISAKLSQSMLYFMLRYILVYTLYTMCFTPCELQQKTPKFTPIYESHIHPWFTVWPGRPVVAPLS